MRNKTVVRLAVIPIEFSDIKHNPKITPAELEKAFFSHDSYTGPNATGEKAAGSLNDYVREQSAGKLQIAGKVYAWVDVGQKRRDYIQGSGTSNKTQVLTDAIKECFGHWTHVMLPADAILFVYAGERMATNRGTVYYPHSGVIQVKNSRLPYSDRPRRRAEAIADRRVRQGAGSGVRPARPRRTHRERRLRRTGPLVRDVRPVYDESAAAPLRVVQGAARLDHANGHRPDETAEADPGAGRVVAEGVLQGPGPSRWQRVLPS